MSKYIISVGAGINQMPFIKRLYERGYQVIAFDLNKQAPGKKYCYKFNDISTWDHEEAISWLKSLNLPFAGAGCFSYGKALMTWQKILNNFRLNAKVDESINSIFVNKNVLRKHLRDFNMSKLLECSLHELSEKHIDAENYVVKSVHGVSSKNIDLVTKDELVKLIRTKQKNYSEYIVQEHLTGNEYRATLIVQNGVIKFSALMKRENLDGTFFAGRYTPLNIQSEAIKKLFIDIVNNFKLVDTVVKIDFIIEKSRIEILEIDLGIPGDYFEFFICPLVYKYSYLDNYINLILGLDIDEWEKVELNKVCFDYIYNLKGKPSVVNYDDITKKLLKYFKPNQFKLLKIKEQGSKTYPPRSNQDAIFGLLHVKTDLTHTQVNEIFNKV